MKVKISKLFTAAVFLGLLSYGTIGAVSNEISRVIKSFSDQVDRDEGLSYTTSVELGKDKIKEVNLFYSSKSSVNIDDARLLIVKITDRFLDDVNNNKYLKGDLATYPFTSEKLDITVFFRGRDGKYAKSPDVAQVSMHKGVVTFYKFAQGSFQIIHQENFQRASKIAGV
ncbi:MAG: hypothetical protein S4CHLAM6_08100 [Chlamydiae bacterium]|nr:hypothetical protein [Chlamydiota bacterium]